MNTIQGGKKGKVFLTKEGSVPYFDNPCLNGKITSLLRHPVYMFNQIEKKLKKGMITEQDLDLIRVAGQACFLTEKQFQIRVKDILSGKPLSKRLHYLEKTGLLDRWIVQTPFTDSIIHYTGWSLSYGGYLVLFHMFGHHDIPDPRFITRGGVAQLQKFAALNEIRHQLQLTDRLSRWVWPPVIEKNSKSPFAFAVIKTSLGSIPVIFERILQEKDGVPFLKERIEFWNDMFQKRSEIQSFLSIEGIDRTPILVWSCGSESVISNLTSHAPKSAYMQLWISDEKLLQRDGIHKGWFGNRKNHLKRVIASF
ncbi:MAG: hypothetical protein H0Z33_04920 [Bacillaceae bacterium]|nr:hypothetical protein [Bacillaceae bacterium]